jgi:hypothetical protein
MSMMVGRGADVPETVDESAERDERVRADMTDLSLEGTFQVKSSHVKSVLFMT